MRTRVAVATACAVLAACAQAPLQPETTVPVQPRRLPAGASGADRAVVSAIAQHREAAQRYRQKGDLARAAAHARAMVLLDATSADAQAMYSELSRAIDRTVKDQLAAGTAAYRAGDTDTATAALLAVLALDADNKAAARLLREIEQRNAVRLQADRAARALRLENGAAAAARASPPANGSRQTAASAETYELEQRIEMFRAGDTEGGLRELRAFVDAYPGDRLARAQIANAVYERGREREAEGSREEALALYVEALALRGQRVSEWSTRADRLRRALADEHYQKGVAAYASDRALAIQHWEASLRFDPRHARAAARLQQAGASPSRGSK
jgi:tetratricopeptide (TPR) repeat protein